MRLCLHIQQEKISKTKGYDFGGSLGLQLSHYGEPRRQNRNRHSRAIRHYEGGIFGSRKIVAKAFGVVAVVVYAKRKSVSGISQCAAEKFDTPLMVCRRNFQSLQKSTNFTPKPSCSRNRQRIRPRRQYPLPSSAAGF